MIKSIRTSKFSKVVACYLVMMIFLEMTQPMVMFALTEGPSQPEFNSFTPIGTSDMVDLTSGDFNYNIPIMDVGGYPINLAYNSGVTMDQEASWVGLGWNLNIGQINRNVRGLPDDFKGDQIITKNNLRNNITVGVQGYVNPQVIGALDAAPPPPNPFSAGLNLEYNNYHGISAKPSFGLSFKISDNVSVGMQLSSSNQEGASVTPSVTLSGTKDVADKLYNGFAASFSPSMTYNSRQGLSSFNLSSSVGYTVPHTDKHGKNVNTNQTTSSGSGSISFLNNTFTPSKRLGLKNNNVTFSVSGGPDVFGGHIEGSITASASVQKLIEKTKNDKAYGYEYTDLATQFDLLDFNREKEQSTVTSNTLVLPVTNYTFDVLSIQGQGLGGIIRPYRGQIGNVFEPKVNDISSSTSIGAEVEGGAGFHGGANIRRTNTNSYTGNWNTVATPFFKEKQTGNNLNYEKVYYKNTGENRIDMEYSSLFSGKLGKYAPITLKLDNNKDAINKYLEKRVTNTTTSLEAVSTPMGTGIKRSQREKRNQVIQKVTFFDRDRFELNKLIEENINSKPHHTAGYIITDENGSRHIYGGTAYNTDKQEVTYSINNTSANYSNGIVYGTEGQDNMSNTSGIDHYYNNVKTPAFAHTYLLTSILSPDYEDLTLNGVSDDDLGSYTKFEYQTLQNYKWRVPFKGASFNEGLKTDKKDQKASYLYGEKELKYVTRIITKTHVAFIDLVDRADGLGVKDKDGDNPQHIGPKMQRIAAIRLYSKPELTINADGTISDPVVIGSTIKPIKTAHFEYDYSLCPGIENSSNNAGKLTLTKVYFTYGDSNMGKYTPYKFNYSQNTNFTYNPKNYDIWGNYKKNTVTNSTEAASRTTPQEFPYVAQDNDNLQNTNASAWSLTSIELPSGGKIELDYESDDYQYVQDKKAMQMFKVAGVTSSPTANIVNELFGGLQEAKYIAVKVNNEDTILPNQTIIDKYTNGLKGKAVYFNFYLNMVNGDKDYVSGYFEMNRDAEIKIDGSVKYILIPMKYINKEGKFNNNDTQNPISVAGWFFGRQYLQYQLYNGSSFDPSQTNIVTIARSFLSNLGAIIDLFRGPNGRLMDIGVAKSFTPEKSWIRLMEPSGSKLGGGARIKKVVMKDGWENMLDIATNNQDIQRYSKKYGQEYDYKLSDGTSSGVATYEPNVCKENPLVQPFYHNAEKMAARTYQEKPFGESFYPTPTVTYRKVTVKNITAADDDGTIEQRKTRSGKVITEHYTSYDFPTKTNFTPLDNPLTSKYYSNENQAVRNMIRGMFGLKINVKTDLTMSQGFVIETNDMNGKMKKQRVLNNAGDEISSVEYIYHTVEDDPTTTINESDPKTIKSELTVINKDGTVTNDHALGMHYDVINDLRESYSETNVAGVGVNVDVIPLAFIPIVIGMGVPERSTHKQILRTAVTTKVINKTGILKEKIAYDLGSRVSTKNLAWDAQTGQVLVTQTQNEYDDSYYTLNYPAYWNYENMGLASENIDISGRLNPATSGFWEIQGVNNISNYLKLGDELVTFIRQFYLGIGFNPITWYTVPKKLWVSGYNSNNTAVTLIDAIGQTYSPTNNSSNTNPLSNRPFFRVIRSGYRNQQMASMASITLMKNPLLLNANGEGTINQDLIRFNTVADPIVDDPKIINANAIEYSQDWVSQCENGLPSKFGLLNGIGTPVNPFIYNIKGEWRPVKSYAYLTGRNATANSNTRNSGYFKKFNPFYKRENNTWVIDNSNWTFASSVTMYNPYGVELENKDALNRYSAAQYGYQYKLPVAVSSNARYQEMGFDGFEDYNPLNYTTPSALKPHFGFQQSVNPNASISNKKSHTGKNAIVVKSNQKATLVKKINGCKENATNPIMN
jgi:hypothetical protein